MSRIGRLPVPIAKGVEVKQANGTLNVKGPKGELTLDVHPDMTIVLDETEMEYLYQDGDTYHFMNGETYEQIGLSGDTLGGCGALPPPQHHPQGPVLRGAAHRHQPTADRGDDGHRD